MVGEEGDGQLWGVDVVPLQGGIAGCQCDDSGRGTIMAPYTAMASRKNIQRNCLELLADVTPHKDWFLLSGVYAGIFFPHLGDDRSNFTNIFQMGCKHQQVMNCA